mmetsp:Transcript_37186/g.48937  ORF Transcript_37186/g.48937 Transcript_37186/m.48937 type:complete len:217 (+) Transcript_37186:1434-2084(+)
MEIERSSLSHSSQHRDNKTSEMPGFDQLNQSGSWVKLAVLPTCSDNFSVALTQFRSRSTCRTSVSRCAKLKPSCTMSNSILSRGPGTPPSHPLIASHRTLPKTEVATTKTLQRAIAAATTKVSSRGTWTSFCSLTSYQSRLQRAIPPNKKKHITHTAPQIIAAEAREAARVPPKPEITPAVEELMDGPKEVAMREEAEAVIAAAIDNEIWLTQILI